MKTSWSWLDTNQDITELKIVNGELGMVILPKPSSEKFQTRAQACILNAKHLLEFMETSDKKTYLESALENCLMLRADIGEIRLLGCQKILENAVTALSLAGMRIGRSVLLNDESSLVYLLPSEGRLRMEKRLASSAKLKVLIVDDSETIRTLLTRIIGQDPGLECVGSVAHPALVEEAILKFKPDILTLDIHMPELNGVQLLKKIFPKYHLPAVMISSLSIEDGTLVLDALEAGAVDYIQKPLLNELGAAAPIICEKIKNAGIARISANKVKSERRPIQNLDQENLVLIGASTGGTEALKDVLTTLPNSIPPILIVQHIPAGFSKAFADRLNKLCPFEVKEAVDGDAILPDRVLIAPGGLQMSVRMAEGGRYFVRVEDSGLVNRHKPSVDHLFNSAAQLKNLRLVAALLTGMGADGAKGLKNLRNIGARTIAQDEATCVVYGMPREAVKLNAAERIVPIHEVANTISEMCQKPARKSRNKTG